MSTRREVFNVLYGEREYQEDLPRQPRTVGDYITMLAYYLQQAQTAWTENPGNTEALHVIRKIGGVAVHCMEDNGALPRTP